MYATWFINEYGDYDGRLRGAVLSEPGAFNDEQLDAFIERFFGIVPIFGEDLGDIVWQSQFMSPADHARADYLIVTQVPAEHLNEDNPAPSWRYGAVVQGALFDLVNDHGFDWTTNLSAFDDPVLFLRSELNETMPLEHQQELASSYPAARIETIPGTTHELIWERPEAYLAEVRQYFAEIGFEGGT